VIRAGGSYQGAPLFVLGLTAENLRRVQEDNDPLMINAASVGLEPMWVLIVAGDDEDEVTMRLAGHGVTPRSIGATRPQSVFGPETSPPGRTSVPGSEGGG